MEGPLASTKDIRIVKDDGKFAILDIYLEEGVKLEDRIRQVCEIQSAYKEEEERPVYILVANVGKSVNILSKLRCYFSNVYFSPSSLFVRPSMHILSPVVQVLKPGDLDWGLVDRLRASSLLPEISRDDPLIKEMGLVPTNMIRVFDFSPHYRVIV
jgi:DNA-directed RNA polymerase subunit H (RpoH/RPB5)